MGIVLQSYCGVSLPLMQVLKFEVISLLSSSSFAELAFLETSALTGENVEEVFTKCTRSILSKIDAGTVINTNIFFHLTAIPLHV